MAVLSTGAFIPSTHVADDEMNGPPVQVMEEIVGANQELTTETKVASGPAVAAGGSMQNKAIDIVREWDPAKAEAYLKVNTNPWTNGVLDDKTIELICVGLNAACTNLQP